MGNGLFSAGILGVGALIPSEVRKNDFWDNLQFSNLPEGKNPFHGIDERRIFHEEMCPSEAEAEAGKVAMEAAGIHKDEIDLVIVQSMIQDELLPSNACKVQHLLDLKNAGAWTIDTCCSSFVTMTVTAANLIATGEFKNILLINSAFCSKLADYSDYLCCYVGDAAGAVLMGRVDRDKGYKASFCNSHGQYHNGFTLQVRTPNTYKRKHYMPSLEKPLLTFDFEITKEIGRESVSNMQYVLERAMEKSNITGEQVDLFLSHQPCHWAHDAWRDSIGMDKEKSYQTFGKYGNIACASIPVNLYEANKLGMLKDGSDLLIASSGAGENHIAAVLKWGR